MEQTFRYCRWCTAPQRLKITGLFHPHPGIADGEGKLLRISRYRGDRGEERHVRLSVWENPGSSGPGRKLRSHSTMTRRSGSLRASAKVSLPRGRGAAHLAIGVGERYSESSRIQGAFEPLTPLEQAIRIADLAQEKLARDVAILDMRPVCAYTDYFVICTGQNPRQAKAIYDEIHGRLKKDEQVSPRQTAGVQEGKWILADYLDVVVHIFTPEAREYYRLEELWSDVPSVEVAAAR